VLVLETVGSIEDFYVALRRLDGMSWLGELDDEADPDRDFFFEEESRATRALPRRLYLIMSNQEGLSSFLRMWDIYRANPEAPDFRRGFRKWVGLFQQLRTVRFWGPEDRVCKAELVADLEVRAESGLDQMPLEVELWCRQDAVSQDRAETEASRIISGHNGRVLVASRIPEIAYHALLAELPIGEVQAFIQNPNMALVTCNQVMYLRPCGQSSSVPPEGEPVTDWGMPEKCTRTRTTGDPAVAILDGAPLLSHQLLDDRTVFDDPDDYEAEYEASERNHGTAMASLVLHGELDDPRPLTRPVYVRPILKPDRGSAEHPPPERIPADVLHVDLVHRAVRRMLADDGGEPAVAPSVKIINLSVADQYRPFDRTPTPWARLLDYLSAKYGVLFIVSAGNHPTSLELACSPGEFEALKEEPSQLERVVVKALADHGYERRLLSPSEAINAVTVGSSYDDASDCGPLGERFEPLTCRFLPSPVSAQGPGVRRSIKPDILFAGGRPVYREHMGTGPRAVIDPVIKHDASPGQRAAAPSSRPAVLSGVRYCRGTSNAAAMATHAAAHYYELVRELRQEPNGDRLADSHTHVIVKALMLHTAGWGEARGLLEDCLAPGNGDRVAEATLARLLGYGPARPEFVEGNSERRVTMLGAGHLERDQAHQYRMPLPPSLSGRTGLRRITATLAWVSPINARHNKYRCADLWFSPYDADDKEQDLKHFLGVDRREAQWQAARRGTVQHEIFEGAAATGFSDGERVCFQVSCRAAAGGFEGAIPYAFVVSLEIGPEVGVDVDVYEEVRTRIGEPVRVAPRRGART